MMPLDGRFVPSTQVASRAAALRQICTQRQCCRQCQTCDDCILHTSLAAERAYLVGAQLGELSGTNVVACRHRGARSCQHVGALAHWLRSCPVAAGAGRSRCLQVLMRHTACCRVVGCPTTLPCVYDCPALSATKANGGTAHTSAASIIESQSDIYDRNNRSLHQWAVSAWLAGCAAPDQAPRPCGRPTPQVHCTM